MFTGFDSSCALRSEGSLVCWGYNSDGQLGVGSVSNVGGAAAQMGASLVPVNLGSGEFGIQGVIATFLRFVFN